MDANGDTETMTLKELATTLDNPSLDRKGDRMKDYQDIWHDLGWHFVGGSPGKHGQPARFVRDIWDF